MKTRVLTKLLAALSLLCCQLLWAQTNDPPYLSEFPTVDRVLAQTRGKSERDTAARQMAVFYHLRDMIERLSDGRNFRNQLTADERRLMTAYAEARGAILRRIEPTLSQSDRGNWFGSLAVIESNRDFRIEVLGAYFSRAWADAYLEKVFANDQQLRRKIEAQYGSNVSSIEFALPPGVRNALLIQLAIAASLVAFAFWRESRRFGVDARGT